MAEVNSPATVVFVEYQCDECKSGYMRHDPSAPLRLVDGVPVWLHVCETCMYAEAMPIKYPTSRISKT